MSDPESAEVLRACMDYIHALTRTLDSDGNNAARIRTVLLDAIARTGAAAQGSAIEREKLIAEFDTAARAIMDGIRE